jgi:serine/threonine protein kinase/Tol biopolymer transport system component
LPLQAGTRIGGYEIFALLGAGGMGEVYRARDTRLGREVAIKILSPRIAADQDAGLRFEREARALATLNHPNIAAIYDVIESDGQPALVLELVDGETLADRIATGPLSIDDTIGYAKQIADALDMAHEAGIVHRDLKPGNIKVTEDGRIKVLDFGLAKAIAVASGESSGADLANSPTITVHGTHQGVILGTAAYMSPEQARGKRIDKRTDIWAFGCVLFEMLTGKRAFDGETSSDVIAAIIERAPDLSRLPEATPASVRRVIGRCLEKDPKRRARDIADVRLDVEDALHVAAAPARRAQSLAWGISAVLAVVVVGLTIARPAPTAAEDPPLVRSSLLLPKSYRLPGDSTDYPLAISRDGTRVAFVGENDDGRRLFVRMLADESPRALAGTEGAMHPFFSPNGEWLGYFAGGAMQKVAFGGASPIRLGALEGGTVGAAWGNGVIVFALRGRGLFRMSDAGGAPSPIGGAGPAAWPSILDDGRTVLYVSPRGQSAAIKTIDIDGKNSRVIASTNDYGEGPAVLGAGGNLGQAQLAGRFVVFGHAADVVRALPVDPVTLAPAGGVLPVLSNIERARNGGAHYFAVSPGGAMVYAKTGDAHSLVWVDRDGNETPITTERKAFRLPALSPDGRRVVIGVNDEQRRSQLWLYNADGQKMRLTDGLRPVWSPDGERVLFSASGGIQTVAIRDLSRQLLFDRKRFPETWPVGTNPYGSSWSRDGTVLLHADSQDLWAGSVEDGLVRPLLSRPGQDAEAQLSPDGKWIAYQSDEFGRVDVCVRRFPSLEDVTVVSLNGGTYPQWSKNGQELLYKHGNAMMAARIELAPRPRVIAREQLFSGEYLGTGREGTYAVTSDGTRFVMVKSDPASVLTDLTLVQNWIGLLNRQQ